MFVFKATAIIKRSKNLLRRFSKIVKCLEKSKVDLDFLRLEEKSFKNCEDTSIDISVFEKTKKAFVIPLNCGWDDVGDWASIWKISKKDLNGNSLNGKVLAQDTKAPNP